MPINNSRIVIGTVRFSGLYGINTNKKILRKVDVQKILNFASKKKSSIWIQLLIIKRQIIS